MSDMRRLLDIVSDIKSDIKSVTVLNENSQGMFESSYKEGGSITHDGKRYDFDTVMSIVEKIPAKRLSVDKLKWVLSHDIPNKSRVDNADISFPIVVTKSVNGKLTVLDGLHRLAKAVRDGVKELPVKYVESEKLLPAKIDKQDVAEGATKDLDIDLQDQQWDAIVGYVINGLKKNMDIGRMELNLYKYAGQEMFDVDQALEDRGFRDIADLANHIKQHNGRYVPPTDFDLGKGVTEGSLNEWVDPGAPCVHCGLPHDQHRVQFNRKNPKLSFINSDDELNDLAMSNAEDHEYVPSEGYKSLSQKEAELVGFHNLNVNMPDDIYDRINRARQRIGRVGPKAGQLTRVKEQGVAEAKSPEEFINQLKSLNQKSPSITNTCRRCGKKWQFQHHCKGSSKNQDKDVPLKFETLNLKNSQIEEYTKKYFECHNIDQPHGKFISNIKRLSKINESTEATDIAPFINMLQRIDSKKSIKIGDKFAVLEFEIIFTYKEINGRGFITPKEVAEIKLHQNGKINYIKFTDGDRYPRLTPARYEGKPITYAAYFSNKNDARQALTAIILAVPDDWDLDISDIKQNINERKSITQQNTKCPHCQGELVSEDQINEKKDACYYKVKSRYRVWPSAYSSGALVKCRKVGAKNWGNKSKK